MTVLVTGACLAGVVLVPLASGRATGMLTLRVALRWQGGDSNCPTGTPRSIDCHPHPGGPELVPGLGSVSQSYIYFVDTNAGPQCPSGYHIADYPARLIVDGKGEIELAVKGISDCLLGPPSDTVVSNTQEFTITGGSGVYAGASGSGAVSHVAHRLSTGHAAGTDTWSGTLVAPGVEFDLDPPTINGAVNKTVRAARGVKRVRVTYKLGARDAVDGVLPVACRPQSGSRFKIGRTLVRCSATDKSANTRTATFSVTVRAAR